MRPVFAGACRACPWGILGKVTADALRFYGYEVQNCWVCWGMVGPREMGDKSKAVIPPGDITNPEYSEMPPDAVPEISATMESNLEAAWNGTGAYAKDNKKRQNYRVIAAVQDPAYLIAAASKKSGITSLWQIKDRKEPTWIVGGPGGVDMDLLNYYGIKIADLKAKGGGILPPVGPNPGQITREQRAAADVFITGSGSLVNTPEQRELYEASQLNDLVFLDFDEALLAKMVQGSDYERATLPLAYLRGVDRPIPTISHSTHYIYVRDDAPDSFAYLLAKALDEHRELFEQQAETWYYDPALVAVSPVIPVHPGALKYYRERGYVK